MSAPDAGKESPITKAKNQQRIVILGAGVSGLSAAHELLKSNDLRGHLASITLIDPRPTVGGLLCKSSRKGYLLEGAAQGVLGSRTSFTGIVNDLGRLNELLLSAPRANRYLILDLDKPHLAAISPNPLALVRRGIFTIRGVLRTFFEFFIPKNRNLGNESLYGFFERRFGRETAQRVIIPIATGIWAGGARKLVVRHVFPKLVALEMRYGSILKGFLLSIIGTKDVVESGPKLKGLATFSHGMETFALELHAAVIRESAAQGIEFRTRLGVRAEKLIVHSLPRTNGRKEPEALFEIQLSGQSESVHADAVFTSVPLWREKLLLESQLQQIDLHAQAEQSLSNDELQSFLSKRIEILKATPSHGLTVVGIGGKDHRPPPQGFGALAPEESPDLLGVLYVHSIVPEHAPKGHFLYRIMIGGDRAPQLAQASELQCLEIARNWLRKLGLVTEQAEIEFEQVFRWPAVIPLQDEGHDSRLLAIIELEHAFPGLHFIGNYISGVGVHDCLLRSKDSVAAFSKRIVLREKQHNERIL